MDQYQDDSGSDSDSFSLEIERGDAVIVYGCNERRYSPPANHVTKVLIGPRDPNPCVGEITIFTNDSAPEAVNSGGGSHRLSSPFGPSEEHDMPQTQGKPYQELSEALSHLTVGGQGKEGTSQGSIPVSPALSRKFRNSIRSEVGPPSKNPFLTNANASNSNSNVLPNGSPTGNLLAPSNSAAAPTGITTQTTEITSGSTGTTVVPLPGGSGNIIDPPGAFQSPDLLGDVKTSGTCPSESSQVSKHPDGAIVGTTPLDNPVSPSSNSGSAIPSSVNVLQTIAPDVTIQSQKLNGLASKLVDQVVSNSIQPALNPPDTSGLGKVQILNAACTQELPPIQESLNTPDQAESSFHFPEPPRSAPLVCVPVKEVKFEEPPKHQLITALENVVDKLGEIVPITVQPSHTTQSGAKARDEPNVIVLPTYSASQFQSKSKDGSSTPQTASNQAKNVHAESKLNNLKMQEVDVRGDHAGQEEQEHSYGIIGNEDNLSEITLPPLNEGGGNHRDHDGEPYSNGHPCHRIRISIDQQSAAPSRRAMAITGLLVVLLISTIILLAVYKFVNKSSPD